MATRIGTPDIAEAATTEAVLNVGTPPAGSNRTCLVFLMIESASATVISVSDVQLGGQSADQIIQVEAGTTTLLRGVIARFNEASIAAQSGGAIVTIESGTYVDNSKAFAFYADTDQDNFAQTDSATTDTSTPNPMTTVDIVAASGSIVSALFGCGASGSGAWGGSNPVIEQGEIDVNATMLTSFADREAVAETVACQCTFTGTQNRAVVQSVEILTFAGGINTIIIVPTGPPLS